MLNLSLNAIHFGWQCFVSLFGCAFAAYMIAKAGKPLFHFWERISHTKSGGVELIHDIGTILFGIALFCLWLLFLVWFLAHGCAFAYKFWECVNALVID